MEADRTVKLVLIGDTGVGKSCLVTQFINQQFGHIEATIGAAFFTRTLLVEGKKTKFQVWDTAGQERYRSLASMYYRGTKAAVVVYDITSESSFKGASVEGGILLATRARAKALEGRRAKAWIAELRAKTQSNAIIVLCGNKSDLAERREVSAMETADYARAQGVFCMETSAKTGRNVQEMFEDVARNLPTEERRLLSERIKACRLQMTILELRSTTAHSTDKGMQVRLQHAQEKLQSTNRAGEVRHLSMEELKDHLEESVDQLRELNGDDSVNGVDLTGGMKSFNTDASAQSSGCC